MVNDHSNNAGIYAEDFLGIGEEIEAPPEPRACGSVLAHLLLAEALTPEVLERLRKEPGIAVLVEAPTAAWVTCLRRTINEIARWDHTEGRDGTARFKRKPDDGGLLTDAVEMGRRVAVVCHAPEAHLPAAFIATADLRLVPGRPNQAVMAAAIRSMTGEEPTAVPAAVDGLDLPDLLAALRSGSGGAAACVRRLERAVASTATSRTPLREVPPIHELHGMGAAGDWCARLVEDFGSMSAEAFWREADRACVWAGPPGVGKTSLAHSLARTLGMECLEAAISSWFESSSYLDKTLAALVAAFSGARARGRQGRGVILFADEMDCMVSREDGDDDRHASYWRPLQQAYLREVEATAAAGVRVILIGATNFPGRLDPAILRPGRFGRVIHVPKPDAVGLAGILRQHLGLDLVEDDLTGVASAGLGATGADVTAWVKAARRTARVAGRAMQPADLMAQVLPPEDRSEADLWRCAVHEAAHAAVASAHGAHVQRVGIVSSGSRGGATVVGGAGSSTLGKADLEALLVSTLAGRAGEETFGLGASTGAHDDLAQATRMAASIHISFGLAGSLLHRAPMQTADSVISTDPVLRAAVERDLARAYRRALHCVRTHRTLIDALARRLMLDRIIEGAEVRQLAGVHGMAVGACIEGVPCHG